jgi:hypothetical protein
MSRFGSLIIKPNTYKSGQVIKVVLGIQQSGTNQSLESMSTQQIKVYSCLFY